MIIEGEAKMCNSGTCLHEKANGDCKISIDEARRRENRGLDRYPCNHEGPIEKYLDQKDVSKFARDLITELEGG